MPLHPAEIQYLYDRRSAELRELLRTGGIIDRMGPGRLQEAHRELGGFHDTPGMRPESFESWPAAKAAAMRLGLG